MELVHVYTPNAYRDWLNHYNKSTPTFNLLPAYVIHMCLGFFHILKRLHSRRWPFVFTQSDVISHQLPALVSKLDDPVCLHSRTQRWRWSSTRQGTIRRRSSLNMLAMAIYIWILLKDAPYTGAESRLHYAKSVGLQTITIQALNERGENVMIY